MHQNIAFCLVVNQNIFTSGCFYWNSTLIPASFPSHYSVHLMNFTSVTLNMSYLALFSGHIALVLIEIFSRIPFFALPPHIYTVVSYMGFHFQLFSTFILRPMFHSLIDLQSPGFIHILPYLCGERYGLSMEFLDLSDS